MAGRRPAGTISLSPLGIEHDPRSEDENGELTDIGLLRSMKRIAVSLHGSASRSYPRTGQYELDDELSRYSRLAGELERRLRASSGTTKTEDRIIGG